ncbi:MAG TPA: winged helix-turn-helix transcriptional regulator [Firmicutes bacterium]|nr:winged helix-turn-helix transcriptional regulator [Bacillota bacterium]
MSREYKIMKYLTTEENLSQRKLAEKTGLSLGMVNLILQRMVRKGLVTIEKVNARSLRYILTPQGLVEKSRLTYKYIKSSYEYILKISVKVRELCEKAWNLGIKEVCFYGSQNEIYHIIKLALDQENISYFYAKQINEVGKDQLVIVWELEYEEELASNYQVVNILKLL